MAEIEIRADRRLLAPGAPAPLSHLGATLLAYSVQVSLRYALYQLGLPVPRQRVTRFVALRLYLDGPALIEELDPGGAGPPEAAEVARAFLDPGGQAIEPLPRKLRGTLWFHRTRLTARAAFRRRPAAGRFRRSGHSGRTVSRGGSTVAEIRRRLSDLLPALGDALLGELVASLDRRRERSLGRTREPVQSFEAARFLNRLGANLESLGALDPRLPSWQKELPPHATDAPELGELRSSSPRRGHRLRGGFREHYRRLIDRLRPSLVALGERAQAAGILDSADGVFFVPFDLLEDLEGEIRPDWLIDSIASNREEWRELADRGAPAETLGNVEPERGPRPPAELAPLVPLP